MSVVCVECGRLARTEADLPASHGPGHTVKVGVNVITATSRASGDGGEQAMRRQARWGFELVEEPRAVWLVRRLDDGVMSVSSTLYTAMIDAIASFGLPWDMDMVLHGGASIAGQLFRSGATLIFAPVATGPCDAIPSLQREFVSMIELVITDESITQEVNSGPWRR